MTIHVTASLVLVAAFVLATVLPLNLGAICFAATFLVGVLAAGLETGVALGGFPAGLFVVLVGVTYLFNVATQNGAVDWLVAKAVQGVRGHTRLIPWIMFGISGLLSAIGAVYAVPIIAPIALGFAARNQISQTLMGLMVIHGWGAGALSPISVYGVIVDGVLRASDLPTGPVTIFVIGMVANLVVGAGLYLALGGLRIPHRSRLVERDEEPAGAPTAAETDPHVHLPKMTLEMAATFLAIVLLIIGAVAGFDVGLLAFTLAVLIGLLNFKHHKEAVNQIPWSVVMLVTGVLTYIGVLQEIGTIDRLGSIVTAMGAPVVGALVLLYVGAVVSAFATSSGVISALVPLGVPLLAASELNPVAVIGALAVASTIVDVSPFSTNGAIVVANATEDRRDTVFRHLLIWGAMVVAVAPLLLWAGVILPAG